MSTPRGNDPSTLGDVPSRGFTQPIFIAKYGRRGRRVRSVSRLMAVLGAAWIVAVIVGALGFLISQDTSSSAVTLPANSARCAGQFPAGPWRTTGRSVPGGRGRYWLLSVYEESPLSGATLASDCAFASGWLLRVTSQASHAPKGPAGWRCRQYRGARSLLKQSYCASTKGAPRRAFSWYPDTNGPDQRRGA